MNCPEKENKGGAVLARPLFSFEGIAFYALPQHVKTVVQAPLLKYY